MKISPEQFKTRVESILKTSKQSHEQITKLANDPTYIKAIEELREHDPVLAELCRDTDLSAMSPLLRVIKYLGNKMEC